MQTIRSSAFKQIKDQNLQLKLNQLQLNFSGGIPATNCYTAKYTAMSQSAEPDLLKWYN
jgi:hypothetical protein